MDERDSVSFMYESSDKPSEVQIIELRSGPKVKTNCSPNFFGMLTGTSEKYKLKSPNPCCNVQYRANKRWMSAFQIIDVSLSRICSS